MNTQIEPLNNDQLRRFAPSIFATNAHAGVSERYSFLPTIEVVEGLRGAGWLPVKAQEQTIRAEGRAGFQKHCLRFQREGDISTYAQRNAAALAFAPGAHRVIARELAAVTPEIVLVNSHDRSSAYQLHAGLFRLVCANGLVIADATFARVSIRHVDFDPASVIDASFKLTDEIPKIMGKVEEFSAHRLSEVERRAFAESAILLKYEDLESAPVGPEKLLMPRRSEDNGSDLWHTFNVVQENLTQGKQKEHGRRVPVAGSEVAKRRAPRTRPVLGIDNNVKLNKALWHLAEALKQGASPKEATALAA